MTYAESATLMTDLDFKGKVKVASLKFADSILIESESVPAHNTRERWALEAFNQPDIMAQRLQAPTVMDASIQGAGVDPQGKSLATDQEVQAATETVVLKML